MISRGGWLLLLFMLVLTGVDLGRLSGKNTEQSAPVVGRENAALVLVQADNARIDGIHQINDASDLLGVINLAGLSVAAETRRQLMAQGPFESGETLKIQIVGSVVCGVESCWMPAAMRMALTIPLHPDRMDLEDWQDLPGVGPRLAQAIIDDRQKNGEFNGFGDLLRVDGIGLGRLSTWRSFFFRQ